MNQMTKKMENEMDTGVVQGDRPSGCREKRNGSLLYPRAPSYL